MSQEDDNASGSLDAAEKRFMMYDERWRVVATFRDQDAAPKETYVYHAAGWNGSGDAAYIDSVILRERDNTACSGTGCDPRLAASDGTLEERRFYCQNWRADVVAIAAADGTPIEQTRYSAYGEPTVYPLADVNMDGKVDAADLGAWTDLLSGGAADLAYPGGDIDFDGWFDPGSSPDDGEFYDSYNANLGKSGKGRQSSPSVDNRIGYAGYQWDQAVRANHVRYRVYLPEIGRWTRRDPLGYVDGPNVYVTTASLLELDPTGLKSISIVCKYCIEKQTKDSKGKPVKKDLSRWYLSCRMKDTDDPNDKGVPIKFNDPDWKNQKNPRLYPSPDAGIPSAKPGKDGKLPHSPRYNKKNPWGDSGPIPPGNYLIKPGTSGRYDKNWGPGNTPSITSPHRSTPGEIENENTCGVRDLMRCHGNGETTGCLTFPGYDQDFASKWRELISEWEDAKKKDPEAPAPSIDLTINPGESDCSEEK